MTDGTSQGLFIVVAIVIFGIFVVLAYILFEDNLSPALASMFTNATEQATERVKYNSKLIHRKDADYKPLSATRLNNTNTGVYELTWDGTSTGSWGDNNPTGVIATNLIKIGWGERMTVMFDVLTTQDAVVAVDFNAARSGYLGNDNYGTTSGTTSGIRSLYTEPIKAKQKKTITYFLVNDNETMNPEHLDLHEHSVLGLKKRFLMNGETFEISNIRYAITKE